MLDIDLYGGKRGLIEHARARVLYALGLYQNVRNIDWAAIGRLVFVCRGNICRSPYASVRARSLGVRSVSFGLEAANDVPADPAASRNALARGVDLSAHRSARAGPSSFAADDLIIVFEPAHLVEISSRSKRTMSATLLGVWAQPLRPHIQDPYGRSDRYFQQCFSVIDANIATLVAHLALHRAPNHRDARINSRSTGHDKGYTHRTPI